MGTAIIATARANEALRARRKLPSAPATAAAIGSQGEAGEPTHRFNISPQTRPMPSQSTGKKTAPARSLNEVGAGRRQILSPAIVVSRIASEDAIIARRGLR